MSGVSITAPIPIRKVKGSIGTHKSIACQSCGLSIELEGSTMSG